MNKSEARRASMLSIRMSSPGAQLDVVHGGDWLGLNLYSRGAVCGTCRLTHRPRKLLRTVWAALANGAGLYAPLVFSEDEFGGSIEHKLGQQVKLTIDLKGGDRKINVYPVMKDLEELADWLRRLPQ